MAGTTLSVDKIAETAERLSRRIQERFLDSGLHEVAQELVGMCETARENVPRIGRPIYSIRIAVAVLIVAFLAIVVSLTIAGFSNLDDSAKTDPMQLVSAVEAGTNQIVLIGLAILFLVSVETRYKRSQALRAIHELRSLAHVIDMHQLTKDPEFVVKDAPATESSPTRKLKTPELIRYLDYCSELLSITGKVAALYAQEMNDRVVLAAVSDVETLVTGMSQKIWQKLDIAGRASLRK